MSKVRAYIESLGLGDTLVKLYGHWYNENDIDFDNLPNSLIFKANNGDGKGTNKIVKDLKNANKKELRKLFHSWLTRKHIGSLSAEPQYKDIRPCIIAEELLPFPENENSVVDYKIWCINGKPRHILVCNDRDPRGGHAAIMSYDVDWTPRPNYSVFDSSYHRAEILPKPKNLNIMLSIASKLSQEFPILRVDLYNINGIIYFGELTFTSLGGMMDYYTPEFLLRLGQEADISHIKKVR